MHRTRTIAFLFTAAATAITALASAQAHAVQRTHVSAAIGADTNTATGCTPVAPCRTFQSAMTVTDASGEVVVLDSGGYGAVTITQSVALIAPTGVYAGISVFPNANGVTANGVTIATPGINVVLRGLTINGQGGDNGIRMTAGNKLTVENCVISNLRLSGIFVADGGTVRVTNTIIRDNAGSGIALQDGVRATITRATISGNGNNGIIASGSSAGTTTIADIANSTIDGNRRGVAAFTQNVTATAKVSVRNSRVVRNREDGIHAVSVSITASNNIVSNNGDSGIAALGADARVFASGNTVSDNARFGFISSSGGVFKSAGNNGVRNNRDDFSSGIETVDMK